MPEKFKNKYQIKSARLQDYDYSQNGMYFVTICTKDKEHFFGEIENGKMMLNEVGKIVHEEILKTPIIRSNVKLDEWIIMPNHLHVIIEIINQPNGMIAETHQVVETPRALVETPRALVETPRRGVSTGDVESQNKNKRGGYNPAWKPNSLGSIINQFKSVCTKKIWKVECITFAWQSRFHDHIIRDETELNRIREYIETNPQMWERDRNNEMENIWV